MILPESGRYLRITMVFGVGNKDGTAVPVDAECLGPLRLTGWKSRRRPVPFLAGAATVRIFP